MKTIAEIEETWKAATLPKKNVLVAKALGWTNIRKGVFLPLTGMARIPVVGDMPNTEVLADVPRYAESPTAVLQAMDDVGIYDRFEYVLIVHSKTGNNHWIEIDNPPSPWTQIKDYKHPTFELACAFAVYAFSELKEGAKEG